jgi:predicted component of type VI protein secretion system
VLAGVSVGRGALVAVICQYALSQSPKTANLLQRIALHAADAQAPAVR